MHTFSSQKGQAILIVVLVMVVSLTIGLSIASRSVTNLKTSTEEENSQRAFSAAEAGVEKALQTGVNILSPESLGNNASIKNVTIQSVSGTEFLLGGGNPFPQDDGADIWLSTYPDYSAPRWSGNLTIYWGFQNETQASCSPNSTTNVMAALEVILITGTKESPIATRFAFDPCTLRQGFNHFSAPTIGSTTVSGKIFPYSATIAVTDGIIARVIPLYANTPIGARGSIALFSQGSKIESVGTSGSTERKIQVYQAYPKVPTEFFQYILFESGS